jgi:DNA-binding beta-propeller fold protein YncE
VANAGDETLSIVDGGSGAVVRTVKLGGLGHPHGLAFDAVRQRIYVTYAFTPKYGAIAAVDARTGQVLKRLTGSYTCSLFAAYAIALDPSSGAVYVNAADETLELAGDTLQVLSSIGDVGPASTFGVDFDPVAGRLYVAEQRQGRLAVSDE